MISTSDSLNTIEFKDYYIILPNTGTNQKCNALYNKKIKKRFVKKSNLVLLMRVIKMIIFYQFKK